MNRREFFKLSAAATALSVGGIALIDTGKTFFLPPVGGWRGDLKIRYTSRYVNRDVMMGRYDATWDSPEGPKHFRVDTIGRHDEVAILVLKDRMELDRGTPNSSAFRLELPRGANGATFIYA